MFRRRQILGIVGALGAAFVAAPLAAVAQVSVHVTAGAAQAVAPATGIGLHTSVYANQFGNSALPGRIEQSGIEMLRYPGGSYSDIYHWSTHTSAPGGYIASQSHFGRFAQILDQAHAQGMVTVNYGSSLQNTMGGQPKEAAAWVAYANGNAALYNTPGDIAIGLDAEGNDWRTVGYWARLRTLSAAQNVDNQYDRLAIAHSAPLGIKYWEIGNEINGNGYYTDSSINFGWEYDRHVGFDNPVDTNPNSTTDPLYYPSRANNAALSPTAYANNFNQFAAAMKAVDPTIKVGAVLVGPGGVGDVSNTARNWDRNVLLNAGAAMDFGIIHWYVNNGTSTDAVLNATDDLPALLTTVRNRINANVGAGQSNRIELHMTEFGYFGTVDSPAIDGVFAGNTYITALANNVSSVHWLEMSKNSYLGDTSSLTPGAAYYGIQVASQVAVPGAQFLPTTSSSGNVEVHTAKLPDGGLGLFLANVGATDSTVNVSVAGLSLASTGTSWLYGVNQTTPLVTQLASGLGSNFSIAVPFRSILALVIPPAPPSADFDGDGDVDGGDLLTWQRGAGISGGAAFAQGDANHDGDVDAEDLAVWTAAAAQQTAAANSQSVPEPSAAALWLCALPAIIGPAVRRLSRRNL